MELKKEIRILGRRFEVEPRAKESLKGITVGEKLSYRFYDGTYQGTPLLFVEPKKGNPSPRTCAITGKRLTEALGLPCAVYTPLALLPQPTPLTPPFLHLIYNQIPYSFPTSPHPPSTTPILLPLPFHSIPS